MLRPRLHWALLAIGAVVTARIGQSAIGGAHPPMRLTAIAYSILVKGKNGQFTALTHENVSCRDQLCNGENKTSSEVKCART